LGNASVKSPTKVNLTEFLREVFYFLLANSEVIVFMFICISQIISASVLSLPMPLLVLLWASLTFPRPSMAFWILLIAYIQTVVLIKVLLKAGINVWDFEKIYSIDDNYSTILGLTHFLQETSSFATSELALLMLISIHRAVLKMFGLWKSNEEFTLIDGCYELGTCDAKSEALVQYAVTDSRNSIAPQYSEEKIFRCGSQELLIDDEKRLNFKVFFRHELKTDLIDGTPAMCFIYKHRLELLHAKEKIVKDDIGQSIVKLKQDNIELELYPVEDSNRAIPTNKMVIVESSDEDHIDFSSAIIIASFVRYFSFNDALLRNLLPRSEFPRKIVDVYKYMFLCDFINFLVLLFGFSTFAVSN